MSPISHDKRLHSRCGFVLGGLLAFVVLMEPVIQQGSSLWAVIFTCALVTAFLAMRHGETFWSKASSIISTLFTWLSHWR